MSGVEGDGDDGDFGRCGIRVVGFGLLVVSCELWVGGYGLGVVRCGMKIHEART